MAGHKISVSEAHGYLRTTITCASERHVIEFKPINTVNTEFNKTLTFLQKLINIPPVFSDHSEREIQNQIYFTFEYGGI